MAVLSQMKSVLRTSLDSEMPQGSLSDERPRPRDGGGCESVAFLGNSRHRPPLPVLVALSPWKPHRGLGSEGLVCAGGSSSRPDTQSALGKGPWSERVT